MTKNIAFIPLKTFSRRLKAKNFKKLLGKPIFNYAVEAALRSKLFDKIIISSDNSGMVTKNLKIKNNKIEILLRNKEDSNFNLSIKQVMYSQLSKYKDIDNVCLIYPTAAMLTSKRIISSYKKLSGNTNSVIGVSKVIPHPNFAFSIFKNKILKLTEENKKDPKKWKIYYASNGSICWVKFKKFLVKKSFYIEPIKIELFNSFEHVDIDNEEDFIQLKKFFKK